MSQVLKTGDVVWVSQKSEDEIYELKQLPEVNGAMVALDPHTGRVLAMTGGYSFSASEFNRATQASRQPGSAFKPFVYAAALDSGFTPASLVLDAPFVMEQGKDQGLWKPENYARRFYGLSTLRLGMEKSRNLMTIRMAQEIGMRKITDYANRFNINRTMPRVLAMALGAGETSLMRLTTAYAMLVNGGKRVEPIFIDRVQDRYGKTLFRKDQRNCIGCNVEMFDAQVAPDLPDMREQVLSPQTAYQVVSMLEGAVTRGTGRRISTIGKPLAGKTGTTNDSRDAWFVQTMHRGCHWSCRFCQPAACRWLKCADPCPASPPPQALTPPDKRFAATALALSYRAGRGRLAHQTSRHCSLCNCVGLFGTASCHSGLAHGR